jgi:hypothetical protein
MQPATKLPCQPLSPRLAFFTLIACHALDPQRPSGKRFATLPRDSQNLVPPQCPVTPCDAAVQKLWGPVVASRLKNNEHYLLERILNTSNWSFKFDRP